MRVVAYAVAVLAAAGIIYFLSGANDKGQTTGSAAAPAPVVAEAEAAAPAALGPDESLVVFKVPGMHCPHGCYPTVKETLAGQPGCEIRFVGQAIGPGSDRQSKCLGRVHRQVGYECSHRCLGQGWLQR